MATRSRRDRVSGYHSPLRERQAAETRQLIITAAIKLFGDRGYSASTVQMIASQAGTSVDTIFSAFGSKSAMLIHAIDVAIVGDDEEAPMIDRPDFAMLGKGKRSERLRTGVHFTIGVYERSVPILKALREAAATDEAARTRLAQYDDDRRDMTAAGLELILGSRASEELVDAIWALASPEVFTLLTEGRGWSIGRTEAWLVDMSTAAIGHAPS